MRGNSSQAENRLASQEGLCSMEQVSKYYVDCVWNMMAHAQKPDFVFRRNGRVHLNRQGHQFSRLVMLDTPSSEVVWRVLATHSVRKFPLHFPSLASRCAITFQLDSTYVKRKMNDYWQVTDTDCRTRSVTTTYISDHVPQVGPDSRTDGRTDRLIDIGNATLTPRVQLFPLDCLTLQTKTIRCFETSINICPAT